MKSGSTKNTSNNSLRNTVSNQEIISFGYYLIPIGIWFIQLWFSLGSMGQIRYEELAESVRNPFWLSFGRLYDGISTNIGWYGLVATVNSIFGFSLFSGKYIRLIISLASLFCLAKLLHSYRLKGLLLSLIGTSPTLLYFSSIQTTYGLDLQLLPILLLLFSKTSLQSIIKQYIFGGLFWALLMWGMMSYPVMIVYLPAAIWLFFQKVKVSELKLGFCYLIAFLLPLIVGFALTADKQWLVYDPHVGAGIFRGSGQINLNLLQFSANLKGLAQDLFGKGQSYYFEIAHGEFAYFLPIIAFGVIIYILIKTGFTCLLSSHLSKISLLTGFLTLLISSISNDPSMLPGIRRNTPLLAVFYLSLVFGANKILGRFGQKSKDYLLTVSSLAIILVHHLVILPANYQSLVAPSRFANIPWFKIAKSPQASLDYLLTYLQAKPLQLAFYDQEKKPVYVRYPEIYAALASSCRYAKKPCQSLSGYDPKTGQFIPLNIGLWADYYWEH